MAGLRPLCVATWTTGLERSSKNLLFEAGLSEPMASFHSAYHGPGDHLDSGFRNPVASAWNEANDGRWISAGPCRWLEKLLTRSLWGTGPDADTSGRPKTTRSLVIRTGVGDLGDDFCFLELPKVGYLSIGEEFMGDAG